jgi:hypothetical protein
LSATGQCGIVTNGLKKLSGSRKCDTTLYLKRFIKRTTGGVHPSYGNMNS